MQNINLFAKPAPRLGQLRPGSAFLDAQRFRDFRVRIPFDSHEVEYDTVSFGQLADEPEQFRFREGRYRVGVHRRIGQLFVARVFVVEALLLVRPQGGIDHDTSDPALERTLKLKLFQFGKNLQKTFLENVGGVGRRARIPQAYRVHLAGKTLVQGALTLRRSAQTTPNDFSFAQQEGL